MYGEWNKQGSLERKLFDAHWTSIFYVTQQPNAGQDRLFLEASGSHKMTHHSL
jgi:hypothetical protein